MYQIVQEYLSVIMGELPAGDVYLLINDVLTFCLCLLPFVLAYKAIKGIFNSIMFM